VSGRRSVDNDDGRQTLEALVKHESRLGQRAFRGIDKEHDAIDHRQRSFHSPPKLRPGVSTMLMRASR
jgi:hypothetical protein